MAKKPSPFDVYCDLKTKRIQTAQEMPARFQKIFHRALWEHAQGKSQLHPEMAAELAFAFRDIVEGTANDLLSPVTGSTGKSGRTPKEASCVEEAVRYRRAVKSGVIKDRHPVKTILEAFGGSDPMAGGISRSTVNKWINDPRFKAIKPGDVDKDDVVSLLNSSGAHYQRFFSKAARKRPPQQPSSSV